MKVLANTVFQEGSDGFVRLEAEDADDMYHLYNILEEEDTLEAETVRMVTTESATGARDKSRVHIRLKISVEKIEYDAEECQLRVKGKNIRENEHVRLGQYHTIEIEKGRMVTITKPEWNETRLDILRELTNPTQNTEVAVLVMQEGLANLCLLRATTTKTCAVITRTIPKKKTTSSASSSSGSGGMAYEDAMRKFFQDIYAAIRLHLPIESLKVVLVGSPGFLNDQFMDYFNTRVVQETDTLWQKEETRRKFVKVHCSTGYKGAVEEILSDPSIADRLKDVRAVKDIQELKRFEHLLATDPDRAVYGPHAVFFAAEHDAIDTLLVTDALCLSRNFSLRRAMDTLIDRVKRQGGTVLRLSTMHASGEKLASLTGLAAILRYPFPDIDTLVEEAFQQQQQVMLLGVAISNLNFASV